MKRFLVLFLGFIVAVGFPAACTADAQADEVVENCLRTHGGHDLFAQRDFRVTFTVKDAIIKAHCCFPNSFRFEMYPGKGAPKTCAFENGRLTEGEDFGFDGYYTVRDLCKVLRLMFLQHFIETAKRRTVEKTFERKGHRITRISQELPDHQKLVSFVDESGRHLASRIVGEVEMDILTVSFNDYRMIESKLMPVKITINRPTRMNSAIKLRSLRTP